MDQLAYLNDPLKFEFEAKIVHKIKIDDNQFDVILEQTYFYPSGGGQPHDTGLLGQARVIDVFKDEAGDVVHRLDRDVATATLPAKIDAERRLGHMQHHSAQHILSRSFEEVLGLETLSVKISAETPSTLDVPLTGVDQVNLERVERCANSVIFENRPIKSYFISDEQIQRVPFRRPPKVKGQIRVVEVDSFDYSACGGTHCPQSGMIGLIKILKTESKNKKLRVHFVAGWQAWRHFQDDHQIVVEISRSFSASPDDVVTLISQQSEQLQAAQKEIKRLQAELLPVEARQMAAQAEPFDGYKLILALFTDRSSPELRELGRLLQDQADVIAVLGGYDGQKLSLVVSCGANTQISATKLLRKQLAQIGGKGGGDDSMAQGGGQATTEQVEGFFDHIRDYLRK